MGFAYWLRVLNAVLSGLVIGLCFMRASWSSPDRARNARVIGLGILLVAVTWGSLARRYETYKPWLPFVTVGLLFCFYGMRRSAAGETTERRIRK